MATQAYAGPIAGALADIAARGWPIYADDGDWDGIQAELLELGLSDGLPLVPPTVARLERMLAGLPAATKSHGQLAPLCGEITVAAVAYNCVLTGCVPAELPVVLTGAIATLEDDFNLLGIQTTTGTPTIALAVHGPARQALGMNSGTNCLGPGNRANACIGRAFRLVMWNIGGAKPEIGTMATMGTPGRYLFCFAEGDDPAFPPLHVRRGLRAEDSAVTVLGVSGTIEVLPTGGGVSAEGIFEPLATVMRATNVASSAGRDRMPYEQFVLLPPELSTSLAKEGYTVERFQSRLFGSGDKPFAHDAGSIHPIITGGIGIKMTCLQLWGGGTRSVTRRIAPLNI